ncbi:MAG: hypothetical protein ACC662_08640, partial [Planctomycetota bacterium]
MPARALRYAGRVRWWITIVGVLVATGAVVFLVTRARRDSASTAAPGSPEATPAKEALRREEPRGPRLAGEGVEAAKRAPSATPPPLPEGWIEVTAPVGLDIVLSQPTEKIGDFDILDYGDAPEVERDGRHIITRWYTLVGWETGYKILESQTVLFRQGDAEHELAPADETVVTVESLLKGAEDAGDVRDLKDVENVPIDWGPYW